MKIEDTGDVKEAAIEMRDRMRADMLTMGDDPDGEFVAFVEVGDGMCQVFEIGPLLECIVASMNMIEADSTQNPQLMTRELFAADVEAPVTIQ